MSCGLTALATRISCSRSGHRAWRGVRDAHSVHRKHQSPGIVTAATVVGGNKHIVPHREIEIGATDGLLAVSRVDHFERNRIGLAVTTREQGRGGEVAEQCARTADTNNR